MLSNTLCLITSNGASLPVKSLNCAAAWPTNISRPLTTTHPAAAASFSSTVSSGVYTASNTREKAGSASAGTGDALSCGCMPTAVVLASTSPRTLPAATSSRAAASHPTASARACARSRLRFAITTEAAPRARAPNASARPAPPAPSTTTRRPASAPSPPPRPCSMASMAASQSVLYPLRLPSGWRTRVLTAPMRAATGSTSLQQRSAASLWGMVTLYPWNVGMSKARKKGSR
mmetsp:Transcript_13315/g.25542  ORF Transcript_13315/g.25542 Transcript_13315/m.25542 type:complete len:233 (+) Transcript_13315:509-1207(+)